MKTPAINELDKAAITAIETANAAGIKAVDAIHKALPKGRLVNWIHGRNERQGIIQSVSGHSVSSCRVFIRTRKGATVKIDPTRLIELGAIPF